MSVSRTRMAWARTDIKSMEKLVLLALCDRADRLGSCWPSVNRLSIDTGADRKTVLSAIERLEAIGAIAVERSSGAPNRYTISLSESAAETSPKNGTPTSPKNGTAEPSASKHNQSQKRDGTSPKNGTAPVPKTGHEPIKNQPRTKKRARFAPPTPEEVSAYGREIGFKIDGGAFVDSYSAKGWMVGKSPMKDWRAAVRTWKRKDEEWRKQDGEPRTKRADYGVLL